MSECNYATTRAAAGAGLVLSSLLTTGCSASDIHTAYLQVECPSIKDSIAAVTFPDTNVFVIDDTSLEISCKTPDVSITGQEPISLDPTSITVGSEEPYGQDKIGYYLVEYKLDGSPIENSTISPLSSVKKTNILPLRGDVQIIEAKALFYSPEAPAIR